PPLRLPRPLRRQAVLLPARGRPPRLRERAARLPRRPAPAPRAEPGADPRIPRAGLPRPHRGDLLRRNPQAPARALARLRRGRPPARAVLAARATGGARPRRGRRAPRALPRLDPATAA